MSDPCIIKSIQAAVTIPVMAKCRIGHTVEAQILQALHVDFVDESEVLTPADEQFHINKRPFKVPFVCGARDLGEALRRIAEGAVMIRTKGEAGTGNVVEAVRHMRTIAAEIQSAQLLTPAERGAYAERIRAPRRLLDRTLALGRLPVVNFAAGGIATPADAALMMQLGCDGVFVGSVRAAGRPAGARSTALPAHRPAAQGIFKSSNPEKRARAIVQAVTHFRDPATLAAVSENLGEAMVGINCDILPPDQQYAKRGW